MYLYFLIFCSLLLLVSSKGEVIGHWRGRDITQDNVAGFKHIQASAIIRQLGRLHGSIDLAGHPINRPEYEYLCQATYCHNEDRNQCNLRCRQFAERVDDNVVENRLRGRESIEPSKDHDACRKECGGLCPRGNCHLECTGLCTIHFSYANRREYEAEFRELMRRVL